MFQSLNVSCTADSSLAQSNLLIPAQHRKEKKQPHSFGLQALHPTCQWPARLRGMFWKHREELHLKLLQEAFCPLSISIIFKSRYICSRNLFCGTLQQYFSSFPWRQLLSTFEGTCLYCKQTSLGNWPVFFFYLIFHLLKGLASKRNRLQVCTFSSLAALPLCFWKKSILEIKIRSTSDINSPTQWAWIPVCTREPTVGAGWHLALWLGFNKSPHGNGRQPHVWSKQTIVPAQDETESIF